MATTFSATKMPARFCNYERLLDRMQALGLDGLVAATSNNVFYLTGFNAIAQKSDEPRPIAVALSRHDPEHPIVVLPDYYLGSFVGLETWVEDFRPYRGVMLPFDIAVDASALYRFVPQAAQGHAWIERAAKHYADDMVSALGIALDDLGLARGRVGFDDLRLGERLRSQTRGVGDGYPALMSARSVKTAPELAALRESTRLNRAAIETSIGAWTPGMTYRDLNRAYEEAVAHLGGHVHDPGAMVFWNGGGADPFVSIGTGEDFALEPGMHIMFDCHGTLGLYCWDGGKTWVVGRELDAASEPIARATAAAMTEIEAAMRPGVRVSELQAVGRDVYRKQGVAGSDQVLIFFHGLGLSHLDQELVGGAEGSATGDWALEGNMVVATHLLYPGGDRTRVWLEDIGVVGRDGAQSIFGWDFMPHLGG